jgi:drug/metabolite transporter (DMT)-like permease
MLWMLLAAATLAAMGAVLKYAAVGLPLGVVLFFRMALSLVPLAPWLARCGWVGVATKRLGFHFLRATVNLCGLGLFIFALTRLTLADITAISFTKPLWVIIVAFVILGEVVGWRRGTATVIGFLGVLIMARPAADFDPVMPVALAWSFTGGLTLIFVKKLSTTEPPARIVFYYGAFGTLLSAVPALLTWQTPTPDQFFWLCTSAVLAALGQLCAARALSLGDATVVAPIEFSKLPVAAVLGFLVFAERPSVWTFVGTGVIFAATFYIARREAQIKARRTVRPLGDEASIHEHH